MKKAESYVLFVLVFILIFTVTAPVSADNPPPKTIHIASAEDLRELAWNCSFDKWSQGRTVVLEGDIDLRNEEFTPIPTFGGIFDGNGHIICGLNIAVEGSNQGLFRYIQEDAVIKDLNVKGIVTPKGDKSNIGGIAGHNNGLLERCNVTAYIKGKDVVGGIAGWNGTTGKIINSSFSGTVYGQNTAGGITGYNAGTILKCSNDSNVNTTVEESELDFQSLTIEDIHLERLMSDAMDIGGISGINTGIIMSSENKGTVGYPSVGYNVGGIVGRQSGYISDCVNYGTIYGRKEVGGIVGQMEPHVNTLISPSKLVQLQNEMNLLQSSITRMIGNTRFASDLMTQNFSLIQADIDKSIISIESLVDQIEGVIIEGVNKISVISVESLNRLISIVESLESTMAVMKDAMVPIRSSIENLSKAFDEISNVMDSFDELSDSLSASIDDLEIEITRAWENMDSAQKLLEESAAIIIKVLSEDEILDDAFSDLMEELQKETPDMIKVAGYLEIIYEQVQVIANELQESDIPGKLDSAVNYIIDAGKNMENAMGMIKEMMDEAGENISGVITSMEDALIYMELAIDEIALGLDIMVSALDIMDDMLDETIDLLKYISSQFVSDTQIADDLYQKTKEELFTSIGDMSQSLSVFMNDMNESGNLIMDDMQSLSDQLFKVMNLMLAIISDLNIDNEDLENLVEDVSAEDIDNSTEGKVSNSRNLGSIEGDINVGGIAGAMSLELKFDPEDDLKFGVGTTSNTVFQTRAIISSSINEGNVISKKNNAGGIVGSMDLGYIKDCIGAGPIESLDGNYIGGIAGISSSPIVSSYAKCSLQGGNYIGGIAGFGKEIKDCYTLIKVNESRACVGAIAGDIDKVNKIKGNYFVNDVIHGIDSISYAEKAEPIDYEALISIESLPSIFLEFQLTFIAEEEIIKTIDFKYGESISENELPEIPLKDGYYGKWEDLNISNLTFDAEIRAVYVPYVTILESEEKRNEVLPIILVEGKFTDDDILTLIKEDAYSSEEDILEQWNVVIPDDGEDSHIIRYYPDEGKGRLGVYIANNGVWKKTDAEWDGKYLVFEIQGSNILFRVIDGGINLGWIWAAAIAAAVLILIVIAVMAGNKHRKHRNVKSG